MSRLARPDHDRPDPFDAMSDEARLDSVYPTWRRASRRLLRRWLANELHDVQMLEHSASTVYEHITHGRISKATTVPSAVIAEVDDLHPTEIDGVSWCIQHDGPWYEGETRCTFRPASFYDCVEAPLFHGPPVAQQSIGEKIRAAHAEHVARYDR